jgi:hypothetical protein
MLMAPSLVRSLAGAAAQHGTWRDEAMADNINWLAQRLYCDRLRRSAGTGLVTRHGLDVPADPVEDGGVHQRNPDASTAIRRDPVRG